MPSPPGFCSSSRTSSGRTTGRPMSSLPNRSRTLRRALQCEISRCDQCDRLPAVAFDEVVFETVLAIAANGGAVLLMPPEAPLRLAILSDLVTGRCQRD